MPINMRGSRKFFFKWVQTDVFLVDVWREDQNTTKTDHHRPTSETPADKMAFRWRADDGPTLNVGLVAVLIFMGS